MPPLMPPVISKKDLAKRKDAPPPVSREQQVVYEATARVQRLIQEYVDPGAVQPIVTPIIEAVKELRRAKQTLADSERSLVRTEKIYGKDKSKEAQPPGHDAS